MRQFTPRFRTTCALCIALLGGFYCAPIAHAQPANGLEPRNEVAVNLKEYGLSVDVRAESVKVSQVTEKLAKKTSVNYIIYDDADIAFVRVENISLADAIKKIAAAADLSVKMVDATYVIEKKAEVGAQEKGKTSDNEPIDLEFREISIKELMRILQEQFGVKIEVAPQVSGILPVIRLYNETPANVIDKVARSAKLSLTKTEAGVYRLGFDDEKTQ